MLRPDLSQEFCHTPLGIPKVRSIMVTVGKKTPAEGPNAAKGDADDAKKKKK